MIWFYIGDKSNVSFSFSSFPGHLILIYQYSRLALRLSGQTSIFGFFFTAVCLTATLFSCSKKIKYWILNMSVINKKFSSEATSALQFLLRKCV